MKNKYLFYIRALIYFISFVLLAACATPGARLNKAIRTNNHEAVIHELSSGIDINNSGRLYSTPLITAIHYQNKDIARLLIENGADPNKADSEYLEPLKEAVKLKDYAIVRLLIDRGANPAQGECDALYVAVDTIADHTMVKLLAGYGADLHKKHTYDAVSYGEAHGLFVEIPSDANLSGEFSSSIIISGNVLFVAVNKGYYDIVKVLLENGADINESDTHGRTPLMIAAINNKKDIIKLLLDFDPDLLYKNQGKNALHYAIKHGANDVADILKKEFKENNIRI